MAGRTPKPWYWAERGYWCVVIRGKRVSLGADRADAMRRFHALMAGVPLPDEPPTTLEAAPVVQRPKGESVVVSAPLAPPALSFEKLTADYLTAARAWMGRRTHQVAVQTLKPFREAVGSRDAASVGADVVAEVIRTRCRWNPSTEYHGRGRLSAQFNWAVERKLLAVNPLAGVRKPRPRTRGASALVTGGDHSKLLAGVPSYLRDILKALHITGCRPCEVLGVTAADFDPVAGTWTLIDHKTAGGGSGRPRVVYLGDELTALCAALAKRYPTGPLFRTADGLPFPEGYYLARRVRYWRAKLGVSPLLTPYGYRHTFATDALTAGVPEAHVAELLGHAGTAMLHKHYSHLGAKADALRAALVRVRGG